MQAYPRAKPHRPPLSEKQAGTANYNKKPERADPPKSVEKSEFLATFHEFWAEFAWWLHLAIESHWATYQLVQRIFFDSLLIVAWYYMRFIVYSFREKTEGHIPDWQIWAWDELQFVFTAMLGLPIIFKVVIDVVHVGYIVRDRVSRQNRAEPISIFKRFRNGFNLSFKLFVEDFWAVFHLIRCVFFDSLLMLAWGYMSVQLCLMCEPWMSHLPSWQPEAAHGIEKTFTGAISIMVVILVAVDILFLIRSQWKRLHKLRHAYAALPIENA